MKAFRLACLLAISFAFTVLSACASSFKPALVGLSDLGLAAPGAPMRIVFDAAAEDPELAEDFAFSVHSSLQQQSFVTVEETGPDGGAPAGAARLKARLVALDHRKGKRPFLGIGRWETVGEARVAYELVGLDGPSLWSETVETKYLVWSKPDAGAIVQVSERVSHQKMIGTRSGPAKKGGMENHLAPFIFATDLRIVSTALCVSAVARLTILAPQSE